MRPGASIREISPWRSGPGTPTPSARRSTGPAPTSPLLGDRRAGGAVPVRQLDLRRAPAHRDPGRPARGRRLRLARLPAPGRSRPALRLPGAQPARPGPWAALQPDQAAAGPLRQGRRGPGRLGRVGVRLPVRRPEPGQHPRLRPARAQVGGHQPLLRLAERPEPGHALPPDGHLRGARARPDDDPPGPARRHTGHLRRHRAPGDHRAPAPDRRHRDEHVPSLVELG